MPSQISNRGDGFSPILVALFSLGLVLAIPILHSPLRVNTDAVTLLHLATTLSDNVPYCAFDGVPTVFPRGLPLLLSALESRHLASPAMLVSLNLICVLVAAASLCRLVRTNTIPASAAQAGMLALTWSWVLIKHLGLPLTDIPFTSTSMACLAAAASAGNTSGRRRFVWTMIALSLIALSISFRRNGIVLAPAMLAGLLKGNTLIEQSCQFFKKRRRLLLLSCLLLTLCSTTASVYLIRSLTLFDMFGTYRSMTATGLFNVLVIGRLIEWGEISTNLPANSLLMFRAAFIAIGLLTAVICGIGLWSRRDRLNLVDVYMSCFTGVLIVWPFNDARFWLPLLPLLPLWFLSGAEKIGRRGLSVSNLRAATLYGFTAYYLLAGTVAQVYSLRLTFSGKAFPERYGSGAHRQAYGHVLLGQPAIQDLPNDELKIAELLKRFGQQPLPPNDRP